jgi:hypothetical protein
VDYVARDFHETQLSRTDSDDQGGTERETRKANGHVDVSPFIERKKAFSTPKAF